MWLAFLTGLFGSMHCVGMCGAIALSLPSRTFFGNFLYNVGRVLSYTFLGFLFGTFGKGLNLLGMQQILSIIFGIFIIIGAFLPQFQELPFLNFIFNKLKKAFTPFFKNKSYFSLWMIGILNGFLPCGLVYLAIIGSVVTAEASEGAMYMLFFGLGTIPMMQSLSIYKNLLTAEWRRKIFKFLPVFVFVTGLLLVFRGLNLGIPYISPLIEPASNNVECH
ncbi:MAG: sulfite exporter TauE/SafE family protein [Thermonemataceae bacterium]|nr:sulfite exporter TauE/SafE family protein [Thermonemataceae bacterium]